MRRGLMLAAALTAAAGSAGSAFAQSFTNGDFETGDLSGWTVAPTSGGTTLVQDAIIYDIDGPGPLTANYAGRFSVGNLVATSTQQGIDLFQSLQLDADKVYEVSFNWAAFRETTTGGNSEGGVFTVIVNGVPGASQNAGSTSSTTPRYGAIIDEFTTTTAGTYDVGVRITRQFTIPADLYQAVDNFVITELVSGACCLPDGSCAVRSSSTCALEGGTFNGANTECATIPPCPQPPTGACCLAGGVCVIDWVGGCNAQGGIYRGDNTTCATAQCPLTLTTILDGTNSQAGAMFDLTAIEGLTIVSFDFVSASTAAPSMQEIEVYYVSDRTTFVGKENDPTQWTLLDTILVERQPPPAVTAAPLNNTLTIEPGETIGIYFTRNASSTASIRYTNGPLGAFSTPHLIFEDRGLGKAYPFGSTFNPRIWNGTIYYDLTATGCYANCDGSTVEPVLNVDDFTCFINEFAAAQSLPHEQQVEHYANCDGSTVAPALNVDDFTCFINEFAQGCP